MEQTAGKSSCCTDSQQTIPERHDVEGSDSVLQQQTEARVTTTASQFWYGWLQWSCPIKKKKTNQNKLLIELCPASSVLCMRSMRISAGSQRVLLFPSPSKRLEHRTNITETTCFVPEDLNNGTVKLGSPYSAPFNLQAEHLGWCFGQTTGRFPWMPRIPCENFQRALSETTL